MTDPAIQIRLFDTALPAPTYKTPGAAAFDLSSRESVTVPPKNYAYVPLNIAIHPPAGYWGMLVARSSLHKRGLMSANGLGVMDQDYCGDEDEYTAVLYNFTDEPVTIEKGDRIMQVVMLPLHQFPIEVVEHLPQPSRGGFGTTGNK